MPLTALVCVPWRLACDCCRHREAPSYRREEHAPRHEEEHYYSAEDHVVTVELQEGSIKDFVSPADGSYSYT
jgi:hypothetical protein